MRHALIELISADEITDILTDIFKCTLVDFVGNEILECAADPDIEVHSV